MLEQLLVPKWDFLQRFHKRPNVVRKPLRDGDEDAVVIDGNVTIRNELIRVRTYDAETTAGTATALRALPDDFDFFDSTGL